MQDWLDQISLADLKSIFGFAFGLAGFAFGIYRGPHADYSALQGNVDQHEISDKWSFLRVAYIHNFSYLGGIAGLVATFLLIRPDQE